MYQSRSISLNVSPTWPEPFNRAPNSATRLTLTRVTTLKCRLWSVISILSVISATQFPCSTPFHRSPCLSEVHWQAFWVTKSDARRLWSCQPSVASFARHPCHLSLHGGFMAPWLFSSSRVTNLAILRRRCTRWSCLDQQKNIMQLRSVLAFQWDMHLSHWLHGPFPIGVTWPFAIRLWLVLWYVLLRKVPVINRLAYLWLYRNLLCIFRLS